ncbi:MAG: 4Fe-4S binding protein, partial [Oscillospiraceae bacterium]|nr:4Fe-4S binding protein [Oscillospiraceae bacterium]
MKKVKIKRPEAQQEIFGTFYCAEELPNKAFLNESIKGDPALKIYLEALCKALGINRVRTVDPFDLEETEKAILEEVAADEPSVIISRRPCALLKYVKHAPAYSVDSDKCRSCKACMKIGCPAMTMGEKGAAVDSSLCVGCGICKSLCKFGAIK